MFVVYVRVIVEETSCDRWIAWFADCPQWSTGGEHPKQAIEKLVRLFVRSGMETDKIHSIKKATREGHLEFDIPLRDKYAETISSLRSLFGIPRPSRN